MKTGSITGMIATTLLWAFVWMVPAGVIEAIDNIAPSAHWFTRQIDMWPQTLGLPGLIGGALFSVLLLLTGRGRGLAELWPVPSGALGAVSGLLVGVLVVGVIAPGLSDPWQLGAALVGIATLLGTASGVTTPILFRYVAQRRATATS